MKRAREGRVKSRNEMRPEKVLKMNLDCMKGER